MNKNTKKYQQGLSILEVLVSLGLGALMMTALSGIYLSTKRTYTAEQAYARLQENYRYAKYILEYKLRMAGFQGCNKSSTNEIENVLTSPGDKYNFTQQNEIHGFQASGSSWSPSLPSWITTNFATDTSVAAGTDVLVMRSMSDQMDSLTANMSSKADAIPVGGVNAYKDGDYIMITDCDLTNIFRAGTGTNNNQITHFTGSNISNDVSKIYTTDAVVGKFQINVFYVKDTGRVNSAGDPIKSLFMQEIDGTETEIIDGIEDFQIEYGIDTDNNFSVDSYLTAEQLSTTQWPKVNTVKINALLNSVDPVGDKSISYSYQGNTVTPNDRLLRKELLLHINLRNRSY